MDRAAFASVNAHYVEDKRRRKVNSECRFYANMEHTHNTQFYVLMKKKMEAKRKIMSANCCLYRYLRHDKERQRAEREKIQIWVEAWTITATTFNYTVFALNAARSGVQIGSHRRRQTYFGKSNKRTNYFVRFCLTDAEGIHVTKSRSPCSLQWISLNFSIVDVFRVVAHYIHLRLNWIQRSCFAAAIRSG